MAFKGVARGFQRPFKRLSFECPYSFGAGKIIYDAGDETEHNKHIRDQRDLQETSQPYLKPPGAGEKRNPEAFQESQWPLREKVGGLRGVSESLRRSPGVSWAFQGIEYYSFYLLSHTFGEV